MDIGAEYEKGDLLKLFNHDEEQQEGDHADAALSESLAQAHRVALANAGKKVVGKNELLRLLCFEAVRFLLKDDGGETRKSSTGRGGCAFAVGVLGWSHGPLCDVSSNASESMLLSECQPRPSGGWCNLAQPTEGDYGHNNCSAG